ncbi:MAG: right-handed parallel beta-helix repeat-containing protein [Anaerolineae bacterium]|nr:right-handed parallel beta-helix repeat-containing protein [Anaerolineae bacterium]
MQRQPATSTLRQTVRKACSRFWLTLLAVAVTGLPLLIASPAQAVTDQQSTVCPANAVGLRPGDNLQNVVNAQPAGATFCFAAGTYQNQSIRPRSGDVYIGQPGAVMDGGGSTRFAFKGIFEPNSRNPIKNVTIRGLTIQRYASQSSIKGFISPEGAVEGSEGWIIENNVIQNNVNGISLGNANWAFADGAIVRNNKILNNSEVGLEVNGSNILFEGNELAGNGWSLNDQDRTWAGGGSKFTDQPIWADLTFKTTVARTRTANDHLIIRNNHVHDNVGIGLWLDVYNQNAIVENNLVENNYGSGIMDELSNGTIIRNNTVRNNRKGNGIGGLWGGGEILIANSQRGDVTGNTLTVSGSGRAVVMIYETYRSQWPSRDYYVHHNTIRFQNTPQYASDGNPLAGILGGAGNDPFWTSNNRYDYNTYYVADANQKFWFWGQGYNWTGFKGRGHETNGLCFYGPSNTPCTAGQVGAPTATRVPPTATPIAPTGTRPAPTATGSVPSSGDGAPYRGQPLPIPGRIEAEDFNLGSNGSAYKDNTPGNAEGAVYRTDATDVDLKPSTYGGYALGWFEAGEWLNYSVNVTQAGYYDVVLFGGTFENARNVRLLVNGQDVSGAVAVPTTAAWGTFAQFSAPRVYLAAGPKTLRLANSTGFLDIDWIEFRAAGSTATTVPPTATSVPPTTVPPTTVPPTTVPPTSVPPTATSLPPQQGASVRAVLATGAIQPGGAGRVDVLLDNPQLAGGGGIRALEARCGIAPAGVVAGQVVTTGALFGPDPVMVNAGVQADNTWVYAVSQSGTNPAITASGVLFSFDLTALAPGSATLTCAISIIDASRATATLPFAADPITVAQVAPTSAPSATPTTQPSATPTTPPSATATTSPSATPAPTLTATATIVQRGQAQGRLDRSHGNADSIAVTVLSTDGGIVAAGVTAEDGSFTIADIPAGTYTIRAEAPGYLPAEGPLTIVGGQATEKAPLTLVAGYLVQKDEPSIDELDVVQLAASYGQAVPPAAESTDLNRDGAVNLPDLGALADNLRATGPTLWP